MKKTKALGYAILAIFFVILNMIAFALPTHKAGTFWVAYVFTMIAFVAQIVIWKMAFCRANTLKSKFLGFPVVTIGIVYLASQMMVFSIFLVIPTLPIWSAIIICAIILGVSAMCMISAEIGREEIEQVETKVRLKVFNIEELQSEVELLADIETDNTVKTALDQLAEKIQFIDPMSDDTLADVETKISGKIMDLKTAGDKLPVIDEINSFLSDRNKKCKLLK